MTNDPTMSDPGEYAVNVRSVSYAIVSASEQCPSCRLFTHVVAICLPAGHEIWDESWQSMPAAAAVFQIDGIGAAVQSRIACVSPHFRRTPAAAGVESPGWSNHCEHCGARQLDHDLHCEPEGAFGCGGVGGAGGRSSLSVLEIAEPFEAAAAGYTLDPGLI